MAVVAVLALAVAAAVLYVPDLLKARALALMPQARAELLDEQIAATLTQETCRGAQGAAGTVRAAGQGPPRAAARW